ncbi:MAG TPA: alpha/beta hydrolase [Acidimicrobiia bacterium]|nr:alpha/beta hydrolase [Acidimicrobiia bacterium]
MTITARPIRHIASWAGTILALGVAGPLLLPLPRLAGSNPAELAGPDDLFVELDGLRVRYRTWGAGPSGFLLLHGFGSNVDSWEPVAAGLADRGRVVAFDRVGFGLTDRPDDRRRYAGEAQVQLAVRLLDHLGLDDVVVVGHSAGGAIALALALDHPVSGLVLEAPSLDPPPGWLHLLARTPQGQRLVRFAARRAAERMPWVLPDTYHDPTKLEDQILAAYRRPLGVRDWDIGFARFVAARPVAGLRRRLDDLQVPTLVITGDDDRWIPTDESISLSTEIAGSTLVVTPECGHVVHEECPQQFVDAVTRWLGSR